MAKENTAMLSENMFIMYENSLSSISWNDVENQSICMTSDGDLV